MTPHPSHSLGRRALPLIQVLFTGAPGSVAWIAIQGWIWSPGSMARIAFQGWIWCERCLTLLRSTHSFSWIKIWIPSEIRWQGVRCQPPGFCNPHTFSKICIHIRIVIRVWGVMCRDQMAVMYNTLILILMCILLRITLILIHTTHSFRYV